MKYFKTFESFEDLNPEIVKQCYNIVKWSNMFKELVTTIKFANQVFCFENPRGGKNECGINPKKITYMRFGDFSDPVELDSLEQFVDFCAQDLANEIVFSANDDIWRARRKEYARQIWDIAIQHDSSLKLDCPAQILKDLGHVLGTVKQIGVLDEDI